LLEIMKDLYRAKEAAGSLRSWSQMKEGGAAHDFMAIFTRRFPVIPEQEEQVAMALSRAQKYIQDSEGRM